MGKHPARADWRVDADGTEVSVAFEPGEPDGSAVFVCAHGAGGNMADRGVLAATAALRARGIATVRFNFPYTERRSGRPDPMPRLQACTAAVVARTRAEVAPRTLVIGGRSMGGRAASMLGAAGYSCDGLLLLAYPLHPAGQPEKLRDAHLPKITMPVLCVNGTRDELCRRDLMEQVLPRLCASWTMHWLEGADHSFHVLKSSGRTDGEVLAEFGDAARDWVARLP